MTARRRLPVIMTLAILVSMAVPAVAKEGMFTPDQIPEIAEDLVAAGLELNPAELDELTAFPMGAVISLGGCSASFVSSSGLAVTNHHCARGSVQYNSTTEHNYLEDGFLAARFFDELPAAPGTRMFVTVGVEDVSAVMREGIAELRRGRDVEAELETRQKALISVCEEQAGHHCQVASFYGGSLYKLIDRIEIRDVRLVYSPSDSIGRYGGDIDNWMWPRHTGDFAFYRAYVGRDGAPADYDRQNVPYQSTHFLNVSAQGIEAGDFVMVLGYPGRTSRYARHTEVENTFAWLYPEWISLLQDWIATIEDSAPDGSDARIRYESRLSGLNNYMKNLQGQVAGAERVNLLDRRTMNEAALAAWAQDQSDSDEFQSAIAHLNILEDQIAASQRRAFWYDHVRRPQLLSAARRLYRLSRERELPDEERKSGYQDRDVARIRQSLEAMDRRYDPVVDRAEWQLFLAGYLSQPEAARVSAFDRALNLDAGGDQANISNQLDRLYGQSRLGEREYRLGWLDADRAEFEASDDPFIALAVALYDNDLALEEAENELSGRRLRLQPTYMQAVRQWQAAMGEETYPDANSTLRLSYGTVMGPPGSLVSHDSFTIIEDIVAKHTGEAPFNAPQTQIDAILAGEHGDYAAASLGSVPVNFMSDLDVTGGNSGSATLNARGELVGLLFDGTLDSVNSDWDFDQQTTRAIHVDSRYMLWVMEKVDGAQRVINEMNIVDRPITAGE